MLKLIFHYAKKYWWQIILMVIFTALSASINLELPRYTSKIINEGVALQNMSAIYENGFTMLGIALLGGVFMVLSMALASRVAASMARDLRRDTFELVERFSMNEFGKFSVASLITRTTNDAQQFQQTFNMTLRMGVYAPFVGIGAVINVFRISADMSWIVLACVLVILAMVAIVTFFAMPKFKIIQKNVDRLNLQTRQTITGLRVIRAFDNDAVEEEKFARVNRDNFKTNLFVDRIMSLISPVMTMVSGFSMVAIVWLGAHLAAQGSANLAGQELLEYVGQQIGNIFALIQYVGQTTFAFMMLSMIFVFLPRMIVSLGRIKEVLDTDLSIEDAAETVAAPSENSIEFKNVSFKYQDSEDSILSDINFTIGAGETVAVIGGTGSGKSTIAKLIPRFYDVSEGQILIGGVDIRELKQADLHDLIGYASQKSMLLSGTIRSNIAYGSGEVSDDQAIEALKIAQAWSFVNKLPKGLSDHVAQGGRNFSGGQKQRLSIARAIAKNAPIMIFDDSFSALDFKTDAKLRAELSKKTVGRTKFIVAQRISSITHADNIIVLDGGKVAGIGKHEELLKSNKIYQEIAKSQLSEEELSGAEKAKKPVS
ncbi:MAG: ABC transporter ATP-binding protein, partial [Candidatus Sacchiramonaceae bacterium]|nr:ABC transporter ATP-binding protein [Candidatus Saccharimonadaceae bacterium]